MNTIRFIVWKEEFAVREEVIDEQHKKIFDALNTLYASLQEGQSRRTATLILEDLVVYIETHFAYEEAVMQKCHYPDIDRHKDIHDSLRKKTKTLVEDYGHSIGDMSEEVLHFLKIWWTSHILNVDHQYTPFLSHVRKESESISTEAISSSRPIKRKIG